MKIIAFAGMPCSGKTEAVRIAKKKKIPVIRMGDMIWEEVESRGLPLNEKNVGSIADQMRKDFGKDIWAKRTLAKITSLENLEDRIVIDGIRNVEEIEAFKEELGRDFVVIAITSSDKKRCERFLKRGRADDSKDIKDFESRDKRELSWGLGTVIASADIVITNDGAIKDFEIEIQKLLEKM